MSSSQDFNMSINIKLLCQMLMQFLQTQASVPASQAPNIQSECTLNPENFTREDFSQNKLLNASKPIELVVTLSTSEARTANTFSHTFRTTQTHIAPKIQAKYYQNQTDVLQNLKNAFSDLDPEFYIQCKLIRLRQANKSFVKFYTKFNKYAACLDFNDKALKCYLKCVLF